MASFDIQHPDPGNVIAENPNVFRLVSWNVDGLDEKNLVVRTNAVCDEICRLSPDVVFLQEVIAETQRILEARLAFKYHIVPGGKQYYVCTLVKKTADSKVTRTAIVPFPNTKMLRNLLVVKASYKGLYLSLMNSHLESTGPEARERKAQLMQAFGEMQDEDQDRVVIFGGDMNLRDKEVSACGGVPQGVLDLWELTGSRPDTKYTWDVSANDNLDWQSGWNKPKLRFDRLYLRPASGHAANVSISSFDLIGKQRLPSCDRFVSDHWGIMCDFDILPSEM